MKALAILKLLESKIDLHITKLDDNKWRLYSDGLDHGVEVTEQEARDILNKLGVSLPAGLNDGSRYEVDGDQLVGLIGKQNASESSIKPNYKIVASPYGDVVGDEVELKPYNDQPLRQGFVINNGKEKIEIQGHNMKYFKMTGKYLEVETFVGYWEFMKL